MNVKQCATFIAMAVIVAACSSRDGDGGSGGGGGSNDEVDTNPDPTPVFPSSGNPDQDSFTVLAETINPRGRDVGNTVVPITALLADQLGNNSTIPDGTQVYFATHGGAIETSGEFCTTVNGACSVNWRSQNPIPDPGPVIDDPLGSGQQVYSYSSGRANLLIWTEGVESFIDNNSNGLFDDGDTQIDDVGDPFLDRNENDGRDNNEEFVDFPIPQLGAGGTYDGPDGLYSGPNCAHSSLCATGLNAQSLFIFKNIVLAMSSDAVCIVPVQTATGYWDAPAGLYSSSPTSPINLETERSTFHFLLHDCFGNPPMNGTEFEFSASVGSDLFADSGAIPNTNVDMGMAASGDGTRLRYPPGSLVYSASVVPDLANADAATGTLILEVTTPADSTFSQVVFIVDPN